MLAILGLFLLSLLWTRHEPEPPKTDRHSLIISLSGGPLDGFEVPVSNDLRISRITVLDHETRKGYVYSLSGAMVGTFQIDSIE